jgi:ATP-binding cassette, subfamily B, bacterial PglK
MQLLRELWSVLSTRQRRWLLLSQGLSLAMACSTVAGIASIAPFFAALGDPGLTDRRPTHALYVLLKAPSPQRFQIDLGLLFMAAIVLANLINIAGSLLLVRLAYRVSTDLQALLFREYLHRPYVFHLQTHSARIFNNVVHESARVINDVMQNLLLLVTQMATAGLIILSVIMIEPVMACGLVAAVGGGYLLLYLSLRNWLVRAGLGQSALLAQQGQTVHESVGAIRELLMLRAQEFFLQRFERISRQLGRAQANTLLVATSPRYLMECVAALALGLSALAATVHREGIGASLGVLTFLAFAAYRLLPAMQQTFASIVRIRAERARFSAIAPDLRQARAAIERPPPAADQMLRPEREIRLRDVTLRFSPDRPAALSRVNLSVCSGEAIGIVGANGSGKSTLVDVLAGLLTPTAGSLEVDGVVVDAHNLNAWRSCIAYVPQQVFLLDDSVICNIALGIDAAAIDQARLARAVRLSQLDDLISTLPDGLQHRIGERGVRLSGGQRQRIGIARALYTGAPVILLDEVTHSLDAPTEQAFMATILRLRGLHTIIAVAHQLSTVQSCDRIVELADGELIAQGSYAQLMVDSASFRRLATAESRHIAR